jgi:hypothetical protein
MAGSAMTGEEILYLQGALIARAGGADEKALTKYLDLQKKMFAVIKAEKDDAVAEKKLYPIWQQTLAALTDEEKKALNFAGANADSIFQMQIKRVLSPWFRYFLVYDPQPALKKVKCPVLAINGEKDLQVPSKENLSAIERARKAGGNKKFVVKELPALNHLFQTATTGAPAEYAKLEETIAPLALQTIGDWMMEQTKVRPN